MPESVTLDPIAVGGVGGSGTRLIARCLQEAGYFIGSDLNKANDNLWFTLLFKRRNILSCSDRDFERLTEVFVEGMTAAAGQFSAHQVSLVRGLARDARPPRSREWLAERAERLLSAGRTVAAGRTWAWKEPNTHVVLDRLRVSMPRLRYIHVARNGLDMAYSANQNQLRLWGPLVLGDDVELTPAASLRFWCMVHRRVLEIGESMGDDFMFLNFDDFCLNPDEGVARLCRFMGADGDRGLASRLEALTEPPSSIGRFREHGTSRFRPEDLQYVGSIGFDTVA